jgi:GT2 family glycosyltransferase
MVGQPDFSIVIVTRNNWSYLMQCLESLYCSPPAHAFDVVVVDNASTDGTPELLRSRFPSVSIIGNPENRGLSAPTNQGIRATAGRYVLLLNDDTLVDGPSLDALVAFLDAHSDVGAAGGRVLNPDGTTQSCFNSFPTLWQQFLIATRVGALFNETYPAVTAAEACQPVDWITSACLMLRRRALDEVGLLDEQYFIYGDEVDLQFRLRRAGWQVYFVPEARTVHFGGRSMNRWSRRRMVYRGHMLFTAKHYGWLNALALRAMLGMLTIGKLAVWQAALIVPQWRQRASQEVASNVAVLELCRRLS